MEKRVSKYTVILKEVEWVVRNFSEDDSSTALSAHEATLEKALWEFRRLEYKLSNNSLVMDNFGIDLTAWVTAEKAGLCDRFPVGSRISDLLATLLDSLRHISEMQAEERDDEEVYLNLYYEMMRKINFNPEECNKMLKRYQEREKRMIFGKNRGGLNKIRMEYVRETINEDWDRWFSGEYYCSRKDQESLRRELEREEVSLSDEELERYAFFRGFYDYRNGEYSIKSESLLAKHFYINREMLSEGMFIRHLSEMAMVGVIEEEMGDVGKVREEYRGKLLSPEAEVHWAKLRAAKMVDKENQPYRLTWPERAYLSSELAKRIGIKKLWKEFGTFWNMDKETLRTSYDKAMKSKRIGAFADKLKKILS